MSTFTVLALICACASGIASIMIFARANRIRKSWVKTEGRIADVKREEIGRTGFSGKFVADEVRDVARIHYLDDRGRMHSLRTNHLNLIRDDRHFLFYNPGKPSEAVLASVLFSWPAALALLSAVSFAFAMISIRS